MSLTTHPEVDAAVDGPVDSRTRVTGNAATGSRVLLIVSLLLAWYTGFRMPNLWSVTSYTPSLFEGFHRRFVVGTVLEPFARASHYNYWLFACVALAILGLLVGVIVWWAMITTSIGQRGLVILWLLLPPGGFVFHEVGYLEQVIYLLLFGAIWLVNRQHWWLASIVIALSIMVHENAILTALPLLAFISVRAPDWKAAVRVLGVPVITAVGILLLPTTSTTSVNSLTGRLATANFRPRAAALQLFLRTQAQSWKLYDVRGTFYTVLPAAVALVVAFLFVTRRQAIHFSIRYALLGAAAIAAPAFLSFGGWDVNRWEFLTISNFLIVLWIWLEDRAREPTVTELLIVAGALLIATHNAIAYFDNFQPRPLSPHDIWQFADQLANRSLFRIPAFF